MFLNVNVCKMPCEVVLFIKTSYRNETDYIAVINCVFS